MAKSMVYATRRFNAIIGKILLYYSCSHKFLAQYPIEFQTEETMEGQNFVLKWKRP